MTSGITPTAERLALRAAYARLAWAALGLGLLVGIVAGAVVGAQGYPQDAPILVIGLACVGFAGGALTAGLTALVVAATRLLGHPSRRRRMVTFAAASSLSAVAIVTAALVLTPGGTLLPALPIGIGVGVAALGLGALAERSARRDRPARITTPSARGPLPVIAILGGGVTALLFGGPFVGLLREQLHHLCSYQEGWICADGVGYLGAGFVPIGASALAVTGGLVAVVASGVRARAALTACAVVAVGVGILTTWPFPSGYAGTPPGVTRVDFWVAAVVPAAVLVGVAVLLAVAALVARDRAARVLGVAAVVVLAAATVVQPGLGLSTLPAIGLLIASAGTPTS